MAKGPDEKSGGPVNGFEDGWRSAEALQGWHSLPWAHLLDCIPLAGAPAANDLPDVPLELLSVNDGNAKLPPSIPSEKDTAK